MKEYDTGDTSAAGKKEWFEQTYEQVILPRRAIDNLQQVAKEFDGYRKRLQVLLSNMTMAHANAAQEGERRAQQVLNRLAARVRTARTKSQMGLRLERCGLARRAHQVVTLITSIRNRYFVSCSFTNLPK